MEINTASGMRDVYRHHHAKGKRLGKTVLEESRSAFLRDRIGTGKRVLDIGCRDGVLTAAYANGNEVLGLDIDDEALKLAKDTLNIETKYVDLNGEWGPSPNTFDVVVAGEIIEHLYFPERVIEKIKMVLKDDGMLLGSVPNAFSIQMRMRLFLGNKKMTPLNDPTHINHFSHNELKTLLEKHFEEVTLCPEGKYSWLDRLLPGWFSFGILFEARTPRRDI